VVAASAAPIALQLAQRGARVAVAARSADELVETTSAIAASGGRAHAIVADLTAPGAGTALARRALDELGRVDILINNAAVVSPLGASNGVDLEAFARAFTVNVTSVGELTFALVRAMVERRWGRVVNVSSGIVAAPAVMVGANAYAATKAAIEAHTVNLAAELAGTGVTVNAYRPGSVDTAMQAWIRDHDSDAIGRVLRDRFTERHAGGLITPEASAAALARRLADDATGEIWDVADDPANPSPSTERATLTRLNPGDTFPSLTIAPADGHPLELPAALALLLNTIVATALIALSAAGDPLALFTTLALLSTFVYVFGYVLSVAAELCHSLARRTRCGPPGGTLAIAAIALAMVFSLWMAGATGA
jgi:NAD(P)-dependent dehydrogenase (short-subunit alcohol dehydrogenase family)